jgi:hypothetical protein
MSRVQAVDLQGAQVRVRQPEVADTCARVDWASSPSGCRAPWKGREFRRPSQGISNQALSGNRGIRSRRQHVGFKLQLQFQFVQYPPSDRSSPPRSVNRSWPISPRSRRPHEPGSDQRMHRLGLQGWERAVRSDRLVGNLGTPSCWGS